MTMTSVSFCGCAPCFIFFLFAPFRTRYFRIARRSSRRGLVIARAVAQNKPLSFIRRKRHRSLGNRTFRSSKTSLHSGKQIFPNRVKTNVTYTTTTYVTSGNGSAYVTSVSRDCASGRVTSGLLRKSNAQRHIRR